jgi:ATP-dependent DNA helicase PIF1
MANMVVDAECRDAKVDHNVDFLPGLQSHGNEDAPDDGETIYGDQLSHLLAADEHLDDAEALGSLSTDADEHEMESGISNRLTQDEAEVYRTARKHSLFGQAGVPNAYTLDGVCIEVVENHRASLKIHGQFISKAKKNKRPRAVDDEPCGPSKKRHVLHEPRTDIAQLLDDVQPEVIHPSRMSKQELLMAIEEIHAQFSLDTNQEQSRAFRIAAEHFAFNLMKQMLLFITRIGGSGKSHIIKAIVALFKRCGCPENLLLSAPTGSAAVLIDGYTIHALTFLPGGETSRKASDLQDIWGKVHYLILDVSMVSAELLCQISERISMGKQGTDPQARNKPFGGVNIIFAGDLGQLRPVGSSALYSSDLLGRLASQTSETIRGHRGLFGASIWQQLTHIVELKKNVRATRDPAYISLLNRFRLGNGVVVSQAKMSDYDVLKGRLLDKLQLDRPTEYERLRNAPVVFGERRLRDLYNDMKAREFAAATGQEYHVYLSVDTIKREPVRGQDRIRLSYARTKESKEALGRLPLLPGMRVMITENLSIEHRVVNGTEGTLTDVIFKNTLEGREAVCAYVKVASSPMVIDGLPPQTRSDKY